MKQFFLMALVLLVGGCASSPPGDVENLCTVFEQESKWYKKGSKAINAWAVDLPVPMAFMYQESRFVADAKPPRKRILGFIPGARPTSAFGYAQATDETWYDYTRGTGRGGADRDDFYDAVHFIGWHIDQSYKRLGILKTDTYHLYLAYHEGHGGYSRRSYRKKPWLLKVARKVEARAKTYKRQLQSCEAKLKKKGSFWPF